METKKKKKKERKEVNCVIFMVRMLVQKSRNSLPKASGIEIEAALVGEFKQCLVCTGLKGR